MLASLDRTIVAEVRERVGLLLETGNLPDELGNHESSRWMKSYHDFIAKQPIGITESKLQEKTSKTPS